MPLFPRGTDPGPFPDYRRYKATLRFTFRYRCAYCNITEGFRQGSDVFGVDHRQPRRLFPELENSWSNLYYCCLMCNSMKGARWPDKRLRLAGFEFVDPCVKDPFEWDWMETADGRLTAATRTGEYSIVVLGLNREECIRFRLRRRVAASRLARCVVDIKSLREGDPGRELAMDAWRDATAQWEEAYGDFPFVRNR